MAATWRHWRSVPVTLYGRQVTPAIFAPTALWYAALPEQPVRIVVVRDPTERRQDEAFFCTDTAATEAFILEAYARRWAIEVTFHDTKQHLGLADPQAQAPTAVRSAAPVAFLVYALVLLWYADAQASTTPTAWGDRPWYPGKTSPSFLDILTALRGAGWRRYLASASVPSQRLRNHAFSWPDAVLVTA